MADQEPVPASAASKQPGWWPGRSLIFIFNFLALAIIFSVCPIDVDPRLKVFANNPPAATASPNATALIFKEHDKAVEEIKVRSHQEDTWFNAKLVLVGGLLAAAIAFLGMGFPANSGRSPEQILEKAMASNASCTILAAACVLALGIDIHVRASMSVVNQLGLWVTYYVEPALLGTKTPAPPTAAETAAAPDWVKRFLGWEEFLRVRLETGTRPLAQGGSGGLHMSQVWGFLVWPHCHFLTGALYLAYTVVLQAFYLGTPVAAQRRIARGTFMIAHLAIFAFALASHGMPEILFVQAIPFCKTWFSPGEAAALYGAVALCLFGVNWAFHAHLQKKNGG